MKEAFLKILDKSEGLRFSKVHQPGVSKGCFLEVFKYLRASKKHGTFVTPRKVTSNLWSPVGQNLSHREKNPQTLEITCDSFASTPEEGPEAFEPPSYCF